MKSKNKTLKERLRSGESVLGTWCLLPSEAVVNVIAKAGVDFVIIDMEHGAITCKNALDMTMAVGAEGVEAIVRVSSNNESEILKVLDLGADGVIVPHIETVEERNKALSFIKYPPLGIRGFSPYVRAGGYTPCKNYTNIQNKRTLSGIIIEGLNSISELDSIIDDPRLDLVYIGAYDISVALGIPGQVDNLKVMKILEASVKKIRSKKKAAGALFHSTQELRRFKSMGIQFLCYRVDSDILFRAFYDAVQKFKE